MNNPNEALNLMQNIINKLEQQALSKANYINELEQKKVRMDLIERQTYELANMINQHEELENKFAELLTIIQDVYNNAMEAKKAMQQMIFERQHIMLINKDVLHWKNQADYYKNACKLFLDKQHQLQQQINKLEQNGKNNFAG